MKKILFYVHSLNKGGAERVLLTIASRMKSEYEIVILTDRYDEREYDFPEGLRRIDIESLFKEKGIENVSAINRLKTIRSVCRKEKAECVIAFMAAASVRAIIANVFSGQRIIATVRSNPYDDYKTDKERKFINLIFGFADTVICQTGFQVEFFKKSIKKKCHIIFNPLFDEFTGGKYEGPVSRKIVATGRLFDYKNQGLLINAYARIAEKYPDTEVVIFGEGPYRSELEKLIEDNKLKDRVLLPGDSEHVAEDIKDALIYVLPSNTEGMPNALMEAMALGIPVISTDCPCGGPASLIRDGENGLLVPVGDEEKMAEALQKMLDNEQLRKQIAEEAFKIRETCNTEHIVEEWKKAIRV